MLMQWQRRWAEVGRAVRVCQRYLLFTAFGHPLSFGILTLPIPDAFGGAVSCRVVSSFPAEEQAPDWLVGGLHPSGPGDRFRGELRSLVRTVRGPPQDFSAGYCGRTAFGPWHHGVRRMWLFGVQSHLPHHMEEAHLQQKYEARWQRKEGPGGRRSEGSADRIWALAWWRQCYSYPFWTRLSLFWLHEIRPQKTPMIGIACLLSSQLSHSGLTLS